MIAVTKTGRCIEAAPEDYQAPVTVAQLIAMLSAMPQDAEVLLGISNNTADEEPFRWRLVWGDENQEESLGFDHRDSAEEYARRSREPSEVWEVVEANPYADAPDFIGAAPCGVTYDGDDEKPVCQISAFL